MNIKIYLRKFTKLNKFKRVKGGGVGEAKVQRLKTKEIKVTVLIIRPYN